MYRSLRLTLAKAQLQSAQGKGRRPAETYTDIMDRLRPKKDWDNIKKGLTSIKAKVRADYLHSPQYPDTPLLVMKVEPLQKLPTTRPTGSQTPYHISIAFYAKQPADFRRRMDAVQLKYARSRTVMLKGHVQGSTFVLSESSPIANDPEIKYLHDNSYYASRPLHLSL